MTIAALGPTQRDQRVQSLDIARGIALFGIFMVNIQFMVQPLGYMLEGNATSEGPVASAFHYLTRVLFESKSYPLFSMLFGMGLMLMRDRAVARERGFVAPYLRRLAMLLGFGLCHALLVWHGDILFYYACFGLVIMWFGPCKPRTLAITGVSLIGMATMILVAFSLLGMLGGEPKLTEPGSISTFSEFWSALKGREIVAGPMDPAWSAGETDAIRNGPFAAAVGMRALNWVTGIVWWMLFSGTFLHVPGLFLLGGAIMKAGLVTDDNPVWMRRFLLIGGIIGLPSALIAVLISEWFGMMSPQASISGVLTFLGGPCVSLGYIGLAMWLASSGVARWLSSAIANTGRIALTNYLLQSILVAAIAQHWGLAMFGEIGRLQMVGIVVGIYLGQLVASSLWLRVFAMGPFEYLWRCWTYLRLPRLMPKGELL